MARKMRVVRVALAGMGLVLGGPEATGLAWRSRAAAQAAAINPPLRRHVPGPQGHRDELGHCVARHQARETDAAGASLPEGEDGRQGGWRSFAPAWRGRSAAVGGPRPLDPATEVGAAPKARGAGLPAGFSAGCPGSLAALIAACHVVLTLASTGAPASLSGRPRRSCSRASGSPSRRRATCGRSAPAACWELPA